MLCYTENIRSFSRISICVIFFAKMIWIYRCIRENLLKSLHSIIFYSSFCPLSPGQVLSLPNFKTLLYYFIHKILLHILLIRVVFLKLMSFIATMLDQLFGLYNSSFKWLFCIWLKHFLNCFLFSNNLVIEFFSILYICLHVPTKHKTELFN